MNAQTWNHKGYIIHLNDVGQFTAVLDGKTVTAPSIGALRKRIDKGNPFTEFEALCINSRSGEVMPVTVVGQTKPRASWRTPEWQITGHAHGRQETAQVYEKHDAVVELATELRNTIARHARVERAHAAELQRQWAKLEAFRKVPG